MSAAFPLRSITPADQEFISSMMYEALFVPEGGAAFPIEVLHEPGIAKYHMNWGQPEDHGLIALSSSYPIGAAWCRKFPRENAGYGFVDENTPEMVIAVRPNFQGMGTGTALIVALIEILRASGQHRLSLNVQKDNQAVRLYQRIGFEIFTESEDSLTMLHTW